jgi:pimeloyl-ACP methyl ester carboxylesterase
MAPVARELSNSFRVIEPFQRRSENEPLTVQRHIDDLDDVIHEYCTEEQPAIVGHSWGAMLALAYAAQRPGVAQCIVLIGCGTFDAAAREQLQSTLVERATPHLSSRLRSLSKEVRDPDVRLCIYGRLLEPLYIYDALPQETDETEEYDRKGHDETWRDMLRLQAEGVYPPSFAGISSPILMAHGDWDPHPGRMTFDTLSEYLPTIQYIELRNCGHYPWRERSAREDFFDILGTWLAMYMT